VSDPADDTQHALDDDEVNAILEWAARAREFAGLLEPTDREIDAQLTRAYDADQAAVSPTRILELNRWRWTTTPVASPAPGRRPT
jgi:hypothetical protein